MSSVCAIPRWVRCLANECFKPEHWFGYVIQPHCPYGKCREQLSLRREQWWVPVWRPTLRGLSKIANGFRNFIELFEAETKTSVCKTASRLLKVRQDMARHSEVNILPCLPKYVVKSSCLAFTFGHSYRSVNRFPGASCSGTWR